VGPCWRNPAAGTPEAIVTRKLFALGALAFASQLALAADPATIDWSAIPTVEVGLFYPGQASYQWLRSPEHKGAARETARGDACTSCHDSDTEEKDLGDALVKSNRLEPTPVKGKPGYKPLKVQAAYDARNVYFRFQWPTANPYPGNEHQYLRFDGKEWKVYGYPKLDKVVQEGRQPGIYEDRFSMLVDDGKVPQFAQQGCFLTCHEGMRDMPKTAAKDEVAANPLLAAIKRADVRKYLPATRSAPDADWRSGKSVQEIEKLKADGHFLDLFQWRAHRSDPVGMADDGYVLEWRNSDAGANPFGSNADAKTQQPRFMYDEKKVGYRAVTAEQLRKRASPSLVREVNAVAFDPNAGWKEGDMVPYYAVTREAKGSAADNRTLAGWKDGAWTVVFVRPLGLANADDKPLLEGGVYNVGFAVHDDNLTTRGHHVSFVRTFGIGAQTRAQIKAVKLP
jgi:hypothetical protein